MARHPTAGTRLVQPLRAGGAVSCRETFVQLMGAPAEHAVAQTQSVQARTELPPVDPTRLLTEEWADDPWTDELMDACLDEARKALENQLEEARREILSQRAAK